MLNKIILFTICSLFVVGCKCGDNDGGGTIQSRTVYDVRCYENGLLILDVTTTNQPTVNGNNTYWRDEATGELVDLTAACLVIPRKSTQPKAPLISSGQIINEQ